MAAVPPPPAPDAFGRAARPTNGMAIAAVVVGFAALPGASLYGLPGVLLGITAIVLGLRARGRIKRSGGAQGGGGLAVGGMIVGASAAVLGALWFVFLLSLYGAMMNWGGVNATPAVTSGPPQV